MSDKYAIIGHFMNKLDVCALVESFATRAQKNIECHLIESSLEEIPFTIETLRASQYAGAYLMAPYKRAAAELADIHSPRSMAANSANTLIFSNGLIFADNTDGTGICNDLTHNLQFQWHKKSILIIGSGSYSIPVLFALQEQPIKEIIVATRNSEKTQNFLNNSPRNISMIAANVEDISTPFDLIINAMSLTPLKYNVPLSPVVWKKSSIAYDIACGNEPSSFLQTAHSLGIKTRCGNDAIIAQLAETFSLWCDTEFETLICQKSNTLYDDKANVS